MRGAHVATKRCLSCRSLFTGAGSRCPSCRRRLYGTPQYQQEGREARRATLCAICDKPPTADDPLQADHIKPGEPTSALRPAHRSCNVKRHGGRT